MAIPESSRKDSTVTIRFQSSLFGVALIAGVAMVGSAKAQTTGNVSGNQGILTQGQSGNNFLYNTPPGGTVIQNSGGGIGADISVTGSSNCAPTTGLNANGLTVIQSGSGTGMRVTVGGGCGPTTGVNSSVGSH
jgi:hypothetical protein